MAEAAPCMDGEEEDVGTTNDSTKRSQLNPPKSDRLRISDTRFMLAFDQHVGFCTGTGLPEFFGSWVMQVRVWFLIWVPM